MFLEFCRLATMIGAIGVFIYIAWIDCRTMEIPDWSHLILIGLACVQIGCGESVAFEVRALGLIAMSLPMFLANLLRQDSFGGGDIKMCGAAGFLLGAPQIIGGTLMALMAAGLYGGMVLLLKRKRPKDTFPLGPFLSLGFITAMLEGLLSNGI